VSEANEKRSEARKSLRLMVTVQSGSVSFTTYSENLSLGGVLLERSIPVMMRSPRCRVTLITPKRDFLIEVEGEISSELQESQRRIRFTRLSKKAKDLLEQWLVAS
jgi:hypothetical protein